MMLNIKILGSACAVSDEYMEVVENLAKSKGLEFFIEKITEEELMKPYGVTVDCMYGYCPGCKFNHEGSKGKHTPALVINEELKLHSIFPMDDIFIEILEESR
ncbi:MAG: thioredoxin family protein [Eubacteriaceae bacterium]|nr:thioredoxin family protein [Eubacteriaceae bacterium]